ncbi:hypothetical protein [Gordonia phthalatica]|uniref:DUF4261 domain-containing protein n=1 Tax=Gordonia phthalatica TaxID=1136941 RepID=A0A0N9NAV3_9ACTN|nr:hypothetical protein [Gordonia phthalatica]ALG84684.1 hypothetical protein ACH46_09465 [Gordonia phthalatica]
MSFQIVTLFQSADDPDVTVDRLVDQIRDDWSEHLNLDPADIRPDDDAVPGKALTVRFGPKRIGVFQMTGPFEFDITALVEQSRLLVNGAPDTDGPYIVVSVVPDDDVIDSLNEDELVEHSERDTGEEVEDALLIGFVVASLIACTHTIDAALFHAGTNLVSANIVRETTIDFAPVLPVLLWAEFGVGPHPDLADEFGGYTNGLDSLGLRDIVVPRSGADGQATVELLIGVALKECADLAPIDAGTVLQTDIGAFSVGYGAHPDEPERPDLMVLTPTG